MDYNHKSLHKDIFGYIDSIQNLEQDLFTITCWYSFTDDRKIKELRIKEAKVEYLDTAFSIPRQDVVKYYNNANLINCGNILVIRTKNTKITIQAKSNNVWYDINEIDLTKYVAVLNPKFNKVNDKVPTLVAIDDFYTYPDEVRKMALNLDYAPSQYHKGKRTKSKLVIEGTKEKLEKVLGKKITNWTETHAHCGVFQHCTPIDPIVYHYDGQSHAAVVFLTPNAPVTTGTSFFRHKSLHWLDKAPVIGENDIKSQSQITEIEAKFIGTEHDDFLDGTKWEEIDRIGNKYNRLAIWDAKLIHAATQYFGKNLNDSRLFHMFFFDIEQ